jgi:hypothetical protein
MIDDDLRELFPEAEQAGDKVLQALRTGKIHAWKDGKQLSKRFWRGKDLADLMRSGCSFKPSEVIAAFPPSVRPGQPVAAQFGTKSVRIVRGGGA